MGCLLFLFYQDLRYRAVYWLIFPVLLALLVGVTLGESLGREILISSSLNLAFLMLQLMLLTIYFSMKNKKWVNITKDYLGWGDILFLLTVAFFLSPMNYLFFYIGSLSLVLLFTLATIGNNNKHRIPLAGLQSLLFAALLLIDWNLSSLNLQSDEWLLKQFGL